ncbi:FAD:protein FMN transferase [Alcanivorax sp. S6407]|uniref:FAD:protein FMN transferase n=1 Tax=Alcanivorax sp. S6407 TaxID=2926424 RepID=UPI001FF0F8A7|nr:FAD:protein FMN transferase [Alcanivorax sp. S6407]MCK0153311.1 FAD:protein FMN transferase [Alcanivorax sp. S6407]
MKQGKQKQDRELVLEQDGPLWRGRFAAMASPCECLVRGVDEHRARQLAETVAEEAWRIEHKYSRYRDDNLVAAINAGDEQWVTLDEETARLMDFADQCWQLSEGAFDITSGVLRRAWRFDGSDRIPEPEQVEALLPLVGWQKVERDGGRIRLQKGMELDLGGIGKEYAVDSAFQLAGKLTDADLLVNFGGDLVGRAAEIPWQVGMEGTARPMVGQLQFTSGALATSGDSRRFLLREGIRYSHVLDPRSGWPVTDAPRAVTVFGQQCTQAGLLSTLALLQGREAENLLREAGVQYWIQWGDDAPVTG